MAMVVRPLIPMEGKKQKNIDRSRFAAPDYETFQELMKKANEISGVDNLKISYADTSEFDRLLLENERKEKKRKRRESDIKLLQSVTVKKVISPQDVLFGIRQQRSSSSTSSSWGSSARGSLRPPSPGWSSATSATTCCITRPTISR